MTHWQPGDTIHAEQINGHTMAWTPLEDLGTFQAGFSPGSPTPRMQKRDDGGTEVWEFEGRITCTSFAAATTHIAFKFDPGHIVSGERGYQCYGSASAYYGVRVGILSNGNLTAGVPTAAGSGTNGFNLDDIRITNPLG